MALLKHYTNHTKLAAPESKELASEGVFGVAVIFFELRLQSLAICDFGVAAIRVTKLTVARNTVAGPNLRTLLVVGCGEERGGRRKKKKEIPDAGGLQNTSPPPLSLKNAFSPKWGEGGGGYVIFPWHSGAELRLLLDSQFIFWAGWLVGLA